MITDNAGVEVEATNVEPISKMQAYWDAARALVDAPASAMPKRGEYWRLRDGRKVIVLLADAWLKRDCCDAGKIPVAVEGVGIYAYLPGEFDSKVATTNDFAMPEIL